MLTKKTPAYREEGTLTITSSPSYIADKASLKTQGHTEPSQAKQTKVTVKYDVGFGNQLFIRGKGANLDWNHGIPMQNISADEWIWKTSLPFNSCEFKVLINDQQFEAGNNHSLIHGTSVHYTPKFPS